MDFTPGVDLFRGYWKTIAIVAVAAGVISFMASYLLTPHYSSTTRVLVRARAATILSSKGQDLSNTQVFDSTLGKPLGQTHAEMLKTRALAERVVADLNLDQRPIDQSTYAQVKRGVRKVVRVASDVLVHGYYTEPTRYNGTVSEVYQNLEGKPLKDSYIIEVTASADDPILAAAIADSATKNLIALSNERFQKEAARYRDFLKGQVDRAQSQVDTTERAKQQYLLDNQIPDDRKNLSIDLRDTTVQLAAIKAQYDEVAQRLANLSQTESGSQTITTGRSSTTVTSVAQSRMYQDLRSQVTTLASQVAALQARRDSLAGLLGPNPTSLPPAIQAKLTELELARASASDLYNTLRAAYEQAVLNSADSPVEVSQVDAANVPLYPDRPLRYLFLLIGLIVGIAGGTGLAQWRHLRKQHRDPAPAFDRKSRIPWFRPQPAYSVVTRSEAVDPVLWGQGHLPKAAFEHQTEETLLSKRAVRKEMQAFLAS
jgi:uncharacterized protein involved in exopolysaccharide biosynthesis